MTPPSCSAQICRYTARGPQPQPRSWQGIGIRKASLPQHPAKNIRPSEGHRSKLRGGRHRVGNESVNSRGFLIFTCARRGELEVLRFHLNCKRDFPEGFPSFSLV